MNLKENQKRKKMKKSSQKFGQLKNTFYLCTRKNETKVSGEKEKLIF